MDQTVPIHDFAPFKESPFFEIFVYSPLTVITPVLESNFAPHRHKFYELLYITGGKGEHIIESSLQKMAKQYSKYQWFIPGHGSPKTDAAIFSANIAYMEEVNRAFSAAGGDKKAIKAQLLKSFPDYKCAFFLSFGLDHALQRPQQHK